MLPMADKCIPHLIPWCSKQLQQDTYNVNVWHCKGCKSSRVMPEYIRYSSNSTTTSWNEASEYTASCHWWVMLSQSSKLNSSSLCIRVCFSGCTELIHGMKPILALNQIYQSCVLFFINHHEHTMQNATEVRLICLDPGFNICCKDCCLQPYNQPMWAEWAKLSKLLIFDQPSVLAYHSYLQESKIAHSNKMWLFCAGI